VLAPRQAVWSDSRRIIHPIDRCKRERQLDGYRADRIVDGYGAEKYARLAALKEKYDPKNMFRVQPQHSAGRGRARPTCGQLRAAKESEAVAKRGAVVGVSEMAGGRSAALRAGPFPR
jgi:hypothetical protein